MTNPTPLIASLTSVQRLSMADRMEAAERIAALEAALKPFAAEAANHDRADIADHDRFGGDLTFGDFRRARTTLHPATPLPIDNRGLDGNSGQTPAALQPKEGRDV